MTDQTLEPKCETCGNPLQMKTYTCPVYEDVYSDGLSTRMYAQADFLRTDNEQEAPKTIALLRESAVALDTLAGLVARQRESKTSNASGVLSWIEQNIVAPCERVQVGTSTKTEPAECPVCTGSC